MAKDPIPGLDHLPPGSITFSDMTWNRTGTWRYLRPLFVRKFAPCSEACPVGNDIPSFLHMAGQGRYEEALEKILEESPFPGVCGRVCYHPCESSCNRSVLDEPVSIQGVERFVSEREPKAPPTPGPSRSQKLAVVGSGPAGLTCAYHLRKFGYRVTVFEREACAGGMLRLAIPRYRLPGKILDRDIERILGLGVDLVTGCRVGTDVSWEELASYDAVFLAIGAHKPKRLRIEGEISDGVIAGTTFLRAASLSQSVSLGRRVAVIGGGNTAIDCARVAARLGAEPVIVYRRIRDEMPAIAAEVDEAIQEGVRVEWLTSPIAVVEEDGRVTGLRCVRNRLTAPDASGRPWPEPVAGSEFILPVDLVIAAVGEVVDNADLPSGVRIDNGVVCIDSWGRSSVDKLWAGGDVGPDTRMVVHAIAAGKRAALSIHAFLGREDAVLSARQIGIGSKGAFSVERFRKGGPAGSRLVQEVVKPEDVNLDYFEPMERSPLPHLEPQRRVPTFEEVNPGYGDDDAVREACRCFHCGACDICGVCERFCPDFSIRLGDAPGMNTLDEVHCKGCGICAEECPRSAVIMERER